MLVAGTVQVVIRSLAACAFVAVLVIPAWWGAGRLQDPRTHPFFRLLFAFGLALTGYVAFVNLVGRATSNSLLAVIAGFGLAAGLSAWLLLRRRGELAIRPLLGSWRSWILPVVLALVASLPQFVLTASSPYWDEVASSAIHLTAPNQFAEGVYPPRHNAFPDLPIKYHYGFVILSGTVEWIGGISANASIDVATMGLWIFVFLFAWFWFRELKLGAVIATWASFALLLGGSLAWLFLPRIEAYKTGGFSKSPPFDDLLRAWQPGRGWLDNLMAMAEAPSLHLRNGDGSLSNLPWDIAAQFQQHAVSLGIALTLVALCLFVTWQAKRTFHWPLMIANVLAFGVLMLAHAVFGGVACVTAGLCLLAAWIRERSRIRFMQGLCFGLAVPTLSLLHGGMMARGDDYGTVGFMAVRKTFGYFEGGLSGFLWWNVAGFGLLLLLAVVAWYGMFRPREEARMDAGVLDERRQFLRALTVFAVFSYLVPQLVYYSSSTEGAEEFTEISKFFFCTHFALALLSAFGLARLAPRVPWPAIVPGIVAMAIIPIAFIRTAVIEPNGKWIGFYHSPYVGKNHIEVQAADALRRLKKGPRDVYFDASQDESKGAYLSAQLIWSGSLFTLTPTRYERNGVGYRISSKLVAERLRQSGRMVRLEPASAEQAGVAWYYARPARDMAFAPLVVRSRLNKLVGEGVFVQQFVAGERELYSIEKPMAEVDRGIEAWWSPRIVAPTAWDEDGREPIFIDPVGHRILVGATVIELPEDFRRDFPMVQVARLAGDPGSTLQVARMRDTEYSVGKRLQDITETNQWRWTKWDLAAGAWTPEAIRWSWPSEIPVVASTGKGSVDVQVAFRPANGTWVDDHDGAVAGPTLDAAERGIPFGGRFYPGTTPDYGLWSMKSGTVTLRNSATGKVDSFRWGGRDGDVLVPGDYDGDGIDEIAVWQRTNTTFYWRDAPDGEIGQATFGTPTCLPIPADYNHDGLLDLAYWEPRERVIRVSFDRGQTVGLEVPVPENAIPAFVNWY